MPRQSADVFCIQETRALPEQLDPRQFYPGRYSCFYESAERKGYSGVAIYSRVEPDEVIHGFGSREFDPEGRFIEARFGDLSVASVYMPSGSSSEVRQEAKYRFLDEFTSFLQQALESGRRFVLCGDWNIAHKEIDLKNWRSNQKNSGFLPEERAWLDRVFGHFGFVDAFREINNEAAQYTWWSNRGRSWEKNVGWRIDYHVLSPQLRGTVRRAAIYKRKRFSDHAPLIIDYDLD